MLWGWARVDVAEHPDVADLYQGAPALGWEADPRLCLYKNDRDQAVILVRLEADGEYRLVIRRDATTDERLFASESLLGLQSIHRLIQRLIAHDSRRGFDVLDATLGANDRRHLANDKAASEWLREEIGDRLWYALGWSHFPGVDILPRQSRR